MAGVLAAAVSLLVAAHWHDSAPRTVDELVTTSVATTGLLPQLSAHLERHPRDARAWAIYARLKF